MNSGITKMQEKSIQNIEKANKLLKPYEKTIKSLGENVFKNWAPFVSVFTGGTLLLIYIYWKTVFDYYHISTEQLNSISIMTAFPILVTLVGCGSVIYYYIGEFSIDSVCYASNIFTISCSC